MCEAPAECWGLRMLRGTMFLPLQKTETGNVVAGYRFQNWELEGGLLCQGFSFNRVVYTSSVRIKKNLDQSHPKTKDWVYELNAKVHETPKSEPSKDIKMKPLQIQVMAISILFCWMIAFPERYLQTVQISPYQQKVPRGCRVTVVSGGKSGQQILIWTSEQEFPSPWRKAPRLLLGIWN